MAHEMKRNSANATLYPFYSVVRESLLLGHSDACDVDGPVGRAKLVGRVFPVASSNSGIQIYAMLEHGRLQRDRKASFRSALAGLDQSFALMLRSEVASAHFRFVKSSHIS